MFDDRKQELLKELLKNSDFKPGSKFIVNLTDALSNLPMNTLESLRIVVASKLIDERNKVHQEYFETETADNDEYEHRIPSWVRDWMRANPEEVSKK